MRMPQDKTRLISWPSKTKLFALSAKADKIQRICCATTESTSILILLKSSKQPHAPVCARPRKEL